MKEITDLVFDEALRYSREHTWAKSMADELIVGISDYAQDQLGDIIFVSLPAIGTSFAQNDIFGFVESVKTASDLFMPVGGEVVAVNEALADTPEQVNGDPYGAGWMIRIRCQDPSQLQGLLSAAEYRLSLDS